MGFNGLFDSAEGAFLFRIGISVLMALGLSAGAVAQEGATGAIIISP
jgi:hypothetical protein